jgi:hypothetical protein
MDKEMESSALSNPSSKEVVRGFFKHLQRIPFSIAPELAEKLYADVFGGVAPELRESETEANFYAVPADRAIYITSAGLASLWLLSYVAFSVADIAGRAQREKTSSRESLDISTAAATLNVGEHLAYARRLFKSDRPWPSQLRRPDPTASLDSMDGRVNNLFLAAMSWILLHEIGHVVNNDSRFVPPSLSHQQEYRADGFATKWILQDSGAGQEREFRVLAVCVALSWVMLDEQAKGRGSTTHPPAIRRFDEAIQHFALGKRSVGLENAGYILKAIFDPVTPAPKFETPNEWFDWVVVRLHEVFPP